MRYYCQQVFQNHLFLKRKFGTKRFSGKRDSPFNEAQGFIHIKDGYVYKANGNLVDNFSIDVTPQITTEMAIAKAKTAWRKLREQGGLELQIESTITPQLVISAINPEAKFASSNLRLSYIIGLNDYSIHDGQTYFINAQTG